MTVRSLPDTPLNGSPIRKPRIAFTIIYQGLHHLLHKGFAQFMVENFDLWVVVEGHAKPGGSTRWCKDMNFPIISTDGTVEYMSELAAIHDHVLFHSRGNYWLSKDQQVNHAIGMILTRYREGFLWQVDCDEGWTSEQLKTSEKALLKSGKKVGCFQFNHYLHEDMIAKGVWGSGWVNRLWKWKGESFATHEPAAIKDQGEPLKMREKFEHYSLVFEQDVKFKSKYYKGHENLYRKWRNLKKQTGFPVSIKLLFGGNSPIGKSESFIHKINTNGKS